MKTSVEFLRYTKQIIISPENWCKGSSGMTSDGKRVHYNDEACTRWCMLGAMLLMEENNPELYGDAVDNLLIALKSDPRSLVMGEPCIDAFNDDPTTTHQQVLDMLDQAIALVSETRV